MPHRFQNRHKTDTIVVACSDFRLGQGERRILREHGVVDYDVIKLPGGPGSLASLSDFPFYAEVILHAVSALIGLHNVVKVVFLHHQSCGAYGMCGHRFDPCSFTEAERNFYHRELRKEKAHLRAYLKKRSFGRIKIITGTQHVDADDKMHIDWMM